MVDEHALNFGSSQPSPAGDPGLPKRSGIRKFVTGILRTAFVFLMLLCPVGLAVAIGVPVAARTEWGRHQVEHLLSRTLNAPVEISGAAWSWRKGLRLEGVHVGPVASDEGVLEFHIAEARFLIKYRKLFSRKMRGDLSLEDVAVQLRKVQDASALPTLSWPRTGRRGFRIERLRVRGGSIHMDVPGEPAPLRIEAVSLWGGFEVKRGRAHVRLGRFEGRLNDGTLWGSGSVVMSGDRSHNSLTVHGSDIEADRALAGILRTVDPVFDLGSGESLRGLIDFEWGNGRDGWISLREGRREPSRTPVSLDASYILPSK